MLRNGGFSYRERLGPQADGRSVLEYLSARYTHTAPAEWAARLAGGAIEIDGATAKPDAVVRRGQTLTWNRPAWIEPDAPLGFEVLHEDDDVLAVAKPAGLPTLPGADFLHATLLHQVRERFPGASPLHRLGRWTSGVVLFARSHAAGAELSRQWAHHEIGKRYRALAAGLPAADDFLVDVPIGRVPHALLGSVHAADDAGKHAESRVVVLERRSDRCLVDVVITTGRPHQIRIHLAAAGHPLVGEPLYAAGGRPAPGSQALPGDPGYLLHAAELAFVHPRDGCRRVLECTPPDTLRTREERGAP